MKTLLKTLAILALGTTVAGIVFAVAQPPDHPWLGQSPIVVDGIPGKSTEPIYKTPEEIEEDRQNAGPVDESETYEREPESMPLVVMAW